MKEIDKKRVPIGNQKKHSGRPERRERKQLEHDTTHKVLGSKETESNDCYANLDSNTVTSVSSSINDSSEVDENLIIHYVDDVNRLEQDIQDTKTSSVIKELNSKMHENVHDEEIDPETPRDSVSSQGDSQVAEDEKIERVSRLPSKLEKKKDTNDAHLFQASRTKSDRGMNKLQTKSSRDVPKKAQKISKASPNGNIKTVPISNMANIKSVKVHPRSSLESSESVNDKLLDDVRDVDILDDENEDNCDDEEKAAMMKRIEEMEMRIEKLEEELREVAALEISMYSVQSDHGSSGNKVHTPARRLSRVYIQVYKNPSLEKKRATIARSIISGLVLVVKSCGNDVPRLTFWLSNIILLREIISQFIETETETFIASLEKVESRIFSQLVDSVWWQIFTPIMQSPVGSNDQKQKQGGSYYSINLWKNAFEDALRRLCPLRAGGHECGCLPVLARIVMEQCVARLDVAMFNAILRESAHQIPTDPISDPIVDSKVLPIPAGDLSFGSGAQLKTAVGNWSIFLNELFGIDDDVSSSNWGQFQLLNDLSNLLMLPKDLLTDSSIREEVCPSISLPVVKRILCNFIPDELCPDIVPGAILEAINAECTVQRLSGSHLAITFPYAAASVVYTAPSLTKQVVVEASSSIETNGYTSQEEEDGELEERNCNGCYEKAARYELLREVWSV
ncbi:uncharacterized protein LOC124935738 [Impatiens glandulifera]|uniref:uncharacterized protein LOC124935738 n=1 Tax=Impatiens glandulifera TaxID=253017 RepID=UPI001FB129ED|nr:uncharacterized protein LOC124935738 [Impatiens glandulifera]